MELHRPAWAARAPSSCADRSICTVNRGFPAARCQTSSSMLALTSPGSSLRTSSSDSSRVSSGTATTRVPARPSSGSITSGVSPRSVRTVATTLRSGSAAMRSISDCESGSQSLKSSTQITGPTVHSSLRMSSIRVDAGATRWARALSGTSASARTPHTRGAARTAATRSRRNDLPTPGSPVITTNRTAGSSIRPRIRSSTPSRPRGDRLERTTSPDLIGRASAPTTCGARPGGGQACDVGRWDFDQWVGPAGIEPTTSTV